MTRAAWAEKEGRRLFGKAVKFWKGKGHALNDKWEKATDSERECFRLVATEAHKRAPWAEREARRKYGPNDTCIPLDKLPLHYADGLLVQHKRAVRVVNKLIKETELDQHRWNRLDKEVRTEAFVAVLAALQKGRT